MIDAAVEGECSVRGAGPPHLSVQVSSEPLYLEADFTRLAQVVGNPAQQRLQVHALGRCHLRGGSSPG